MYLRQRESAELDLDLAAPSVRPAERSLDHRLLQDDRHPDRRDPRLPVRRVRFRAGVRDRRVRDVERSGGRREPRSYSENLGQPERHVPRGADLHDDLPRVRQDAEDPPRTLAPHELARVCHGHVVLAAASEANGLLEVVRREIRTQFLPGGLRDQEAEAPRGVGERRREGRGLLRRGGGIGGGAGPRREFDVPLRHAGRIRDRGPRRGIFEGGSHRVGRRSLRAPPESEDSDGDPRAEREECDERRLCVHREPRRGG